MKGELETAWAWREKRGVLDELESVRVFHGPGEGSGNLSRIAIDRFGAGHFWVTEWSSGEKGEVSRGRNPAIEVISEFLRARGALSAVALLRPEQGIPDEPITLFGSPSEERFESREDSARFWIQLLGARHPGLFLDHLPLRRWLRARMRGLRVLNTFSYTGSLSVAAGQGDASHVTTLDLSKPTIQWAEENWKLNGLSSDRARFIYGDYFEWLPRLKRDGELYDCVILDPPSFSRGKKGNFSTAKDLRKLHSLAISVLARGGHLVTSINSANVPWEKFEGEVQAALREHSRSATVVSEIGLPETFPTRFGTSHTQRYLKGWVLRIS